MSDEGRLQSDIQYLAKTGNAAVFVADGRLDRAIEDTVQLAQAELTQDAEQSHLLALHIRVLRNAVAGCQPAQQALCSDFHRIQPLLVRATTFHAMMDAQTLPLTRALAQMLSNLITLNPTVQAQLWPSLTSSDKLALKLVSSPDPTTSAAAQIMLINFVKSPEPAIIDQICSTPAGLDIIQALLQVAESAVLQQASDEADDALLDTDALGLTYSFFVHLFEQGYAVHLLHELQPKADLQRSYDQPIVAHPQLVLLKLLDSWLHYGQKQLIAGECSEGGPNLDGLIDVFMQWSSFARQAMLEGMGEEGRQDSRLIGVHQALLLVLQCLLSLALAADGWSSSDTADGNLRSVARNVLGSMRDRLVDELVELLNQTHLYAPAVSPFQSTASTSVPLPAGHALSSTGQGSEAKPGYGFDHLKRDIVRVIGSLVYAPQPSGDDGDFSYTQAQIRRVQDQVREKGGLFYVLNMTVLDERNPYMREHAIFALRYLLAGNQASQDLVSSLQRVDGVDGAVPV